jgi:hypothetical protein
MKRSVWAALSVFALGACEAPERQRPGEPQPPPPPPAAMAETARCTNPQHGYSVSYPADWHTNTSEVMPTCSFFDPRPIRLPPASEVPIDIAIQMGREQAGFEEVAGASPGEQQLSREEMVWLDRRASRIESVSTGEGLYDAGLRSYRVVVDLGGEVFVAATFDAGELPFEEKRRILDSMLGTLELTAP